MQMMMVEMTARRLFFIYIVLCATSYTAFLVFRRRFLQSISRFETRLIGEGIQDLAACSWRVD